ncbi:NAD(P)H-hydrate epimerase, partial [Ferrimicrobium sp.]|uniref:NAD(P)H-hydrate epimerase n=1 Tax=Ferrimicrobium sp. TaxID=2926050 RepID=UPI002604CCAD
MIEDFHIELPQMMENAGRNLADLTQSLFLPRSATVLVGPGGNGGGGLVAARHLHNRGIDVTVTVATRNVASVTAHQLDIIERLGIEVRGEPTPADVVIDSLIGYGLSGDPSGRFAELINWANATSTPVLALDTPSGLDLTAGAAARPCVQAVATMTLALPKVGLARVVNVGSLYLADISVPPSLFVAMGLEVPVIFKSGSVVAVRDR